MKTTHLIRSLPLLIVGSAMLLALALLGGSRLAFAGSPPISPAFSVATTSLAVTINTSTRILATTTNPTGIPGVTAFTRSYAMICNPNTVAVLIRLDGDKPADGRSFGGYWLNTNSCYEVQDKMLYQGSIQASSSDQSSVKVLVSDYVY